jgi:dipeptidase
MCDTLVALPSATRDGATLLAKNSDRHPNEAQVVELVPSAEHASGASVRCTFLTIPQARRTHRALLCRPFWMWGAEMGVNEHGVAIGNEAVFTKEPQETQPALTGMDLLRLGLERASSADEALDVITSLLEAHGQGGNCAYDGELRYHNGFLIADRTSAWVLETAGRHWIAERVERVRSISNAVSIRGRGDRRSEGLVRHAIARGWTESEASFDFAEDARDFLYTSFGAGAPRRARSGNYLCSLDGSLSASMLMAFLRSHAEPPGRYDPADGLLGADVCMHAGFGPVRIGHTVGSLVVRIGEEGVTAWVTGTSTPCTSIFAPVWLDAGLPDALFAAPGADPDRHSLWWRHEALAREVQRDYAPRAMSYAADRDALEESFVKRAEAARGQSADARRALSEACFHEADEARREWRASVDAIRASEHRVPRLFDLAWRRFDRRAGR